MEACAAMICEKISGPLTGLTPPITVTLPMPLDVVWGSNAGFRTYSVHQKENALV
jgi:hypothetical protein